LSAGKPGEAVPPASARGPLSKAAGYVQQLHSAATVADAPAILPDSAVRSLWGALIEGIPLPDDNPLESYRPPVDKIPKDFFRTTASLSKPRRGHGSGEASSGERAPCAGSPPALGRGMLSLSTSASSTGSTPTGGRGRQMNMTLAQEPKMSAALIGRHQLSGTTITPASSPHGSSGSTAVHASVGTVGQGGGSGTPAQTPHAGTGSAAGAAGQPGQGSRNGSRGSSPWHPPSPMTEFSTASDCVSSAQPSGSESCGAEHPMPRYVGTQCNFDSCTSADTSQSDTPQWNRSAQLSDSDCATPRSHEAAGTGHVEEERTSLNHPIWDNMKSEITRVELSRDRLPRRLDSAQSPGGAGAMGSFREAVGMNESGPVIPHGSAARREVLNSHTTTGSDESGPSGIRPGHGPYGAHPLSPNTGVVPRWRGPRARPPS